MLRDQTPRAGAVPDIALLSATYVLVQLLLRNHREE